MTSTDEDAPRIDRTDWIEWTDAGREIEWVGAELSALAAMARGTVRGRDEDRRAAQR